MKTSICKIQDYAIRYRQLLLPVVSGISQTNEYKKVVLQGQPTVHHKICFNQEIIKRISIGTPAGEAEIMLVSDREDFEHLYCALAYKCEPIPIPASVGAITINGIINWSKINTHKHEYLALGNTDWQAEFRRFTAEKSNYCDNIILLSSGPYSSVPAQNIRISEKEWEQKSVAIRMYHELTHFICRKLYPEKMDVIRDEIYADCIGLIAAFGAYDPFLARVFLGIETEIYRTGGRLEHYAPKHSKEDILQAQKWIKEAEMRVAEHWYNNMSEERPELAIFNLLMKIY